MLPMQFGILCSSHKLDKTVVVVDRNNQITDDEFDPLNLLSPITLNILNIIILDSNLFSEVKSKLEMTLGHSMLINFNDLFKI
ncbi:hypothetical protein EPI10_023055 [Gossypium australe]|uniref:Uncharacterized protein n=1 Tax=Gossypium australe TaxID=47621 RepID=A0A5B6VUD3_9ROSI|nr:hypothetical protein EPI10_023055 [Gossypium australe]